MKKYPIMLVFLTVIADAVGIAGGALIASGLIGQSGSQYFHSADTARFDQTLDEI